MLTRFFCALCCTLSSYSFSHVVITSTHYANSYSQFDIAVPHGCEGFDTLKIEMEIPLSLTSVRPVIDSMGEAQIIKNEEDQVTTLIWQKDPADLFASDSHAYTLSVRAKTPDLPYATLYFPTIQTCQDVDGNSYENAWVGQQSHHEESTEKPAPRTLLNPKVTSGWHTFTATEHMHDMHIFNNAEIVWKGSEAYSANPHTLSMIEADPNTTVLMMIHPGDEVWVKY